MKLYPSKRALAEAIWLEVFGDTSEFLQLYFSTIYQSEETDILLDYTSYAPIAHLGRPSYELSVWGQSFRGAYISGAATIVQARNAGLMSQLLRAALYRIYQSGIEFSFLIPAEPWLYDYYQRFGYAAVCGRKVAFSSPSRQPLPDSLSLSEVLSPDSYHHYCKKRKAWSAPHIHHNYTQWRALIEDAFLAGGGYRRGMIHRGSEENSSTQVVLLDEDFRTQALPLGLLIGSSWIQFPPALVSHTERHGMLRLVQIPKLLQRFAEIHPEIDWQFDLYDATLPINTGRYRICRGRLFYYPLTVDRLASKALLPEELALHLFPKADFTIDLMLD